MGGSSRRLLTFASLFSGCGGLDLGFIEAGYWPLWANDNDPVAVDTYRKMIGSHIALGDIDSVRWPEPGSAAVVIGGPPCQGFSVAGKRDPHDPRSRHVWNFLRFVEHVRPQAFVLENVAALGINPRWAGLRQQLQKEARRLGYGTTLLVLNASHYGVPQARERMFLVGLQSGRAISVPPVSGDSPPSLRSVLEGLPDFGESGNDTLCPAKVTLAKRPVLRKSPFAGLLLNGKGRVLNLDAPAPTLPATMGGNRTPIIDQACLTTGAPNWVVRYHSALTEGSDAPVEPSPHLRRLTVEEAAAIQSFPPGMRFSGSVTAQFRQIGNAVPPRLAFHVARALRRELERDDRARERLPLRQQELARA